MCNLVLHTEILESATAKGFSVAHLYYLSQRVNLVTHIVHYQSQQRHDRIIIVEMWLCMFTITLYLPSLPCL